MNTPEISNQDIISVHALGKRFAAGSRAIGSYQKLSDQLLRLSTAPWRWLQGLGTQKSRNQRPDFEALQDITFSIKRGETVGIIGRNGAGKSTLLKILSRVTEPTSGTITLRGRVASLLEVGTGFHPELTGRENIYLNGAILGMTRAEIHARFDAIVAFAEVEPFLDLPVKRYSSGMYLRLAFAVAAHLEPDILIVDEVLAVGDAQFQKKCLGKLQDSAATEGRTILFVSHNLSALRQLTTRSLVLQQGRLVFDGPTHDAICHYLDHQAILAEVTHLPRLAGCMGGARFTELRFKEEPAVFTTGAAMTFLAGIAWDQPVQQARISLTVLTQENSPVGSGFSASCLTMTTPGLSRVSITIPATSLAPGRYHCTIALGNTSGSAAVNMDAVSDVLFFEIIAADYDSRVPTVWHSGWGSLQLDELKIAPAP